MVKSDAKKHTAGMLVNDESGKQKLAFDGGVAAAPGTVKHTGRTNTEQYECLRCDTKQIELKSVRFKASRARCRHCGGAVYPVISTPKKEVLVRKCRDCGTKLRTTNTTSYCSVCGGR